MSHCCVCSYFIPSLKFFFPFLPSARAAPGSSRHNDRKAARNLRPEVPMDLFMFMFMVDDPLYPYLYFLGAQAPLPALFLQASLSEQAGKVACAPRRQMP